jgi:quercetin dioxygenase-like cupin family protein
VDIITITDLALQPTPLGGQSRILFDKPEVRVVNLVLADGERVAAHEAPVDVVFLVLNGSASLTAGPQRSVIGAAKWCFARREFPEA